MVIALGVLVLGYQYRLAYFVWVRAGLHFLWRNQVKQWTSVEQQSLLLIERGLSDALAHQNRLETVGYYRLSGYFYPLRKRCSHQIGRADEFVDGALLQHAFDLYDFDDKLRLVVWKALRELELFIRADVARVLGEADRYFHEHITDAELCARQQKTARIFTSKLSQLKQRSQEEFVRHHDEHYGGKLPIWVVVEILEFGQLINLYSLSPFPLRQAIAQRYGVRADELESWLRSLNYLRNICAHHSRLFNRSIVIKPLLKHQKNTFLTPALTKPHKPFALLTLLAFLLKKRGFHTLVDEIKDCLASFPNNIPTISETAMGAPQNWDTLEVWN